MNSSRRLRRAAAWTGGLLLLAAAGVITRGYVTSSPTTAPAAHQAAAAAAKQATRGVEPLISQKSAANPSPSSRSSEVRAHKQRLAQEGESLRIAARERKHDELDWDAPRPGPPEAVPSPMGKREAQIAPAEKLSQLERLTAVVKERRARLQTPAERPSELEAQGARGPILALRLERRLGELERTAQALREEVQEESAARPH